MFKPILALLRPPQLEYLNATPLTQEQHVPKIFYGITSVIGLLVIGFILWSSITTINEIARAEGEVIPNGYVQVIQHLEGGIVTDILVREGDIVAENQLLVTLSDANSREDLAALLVKQRGLKLQAERLRAFVEQRDADYSRFKATPEQIAEQQIIAKGMRNAISTEQTVSKTQERQKLDALNILKSRLSTARKSLGIAQESFNTQKALLNKGLTSQGLYLAAKDAYTTAKGRIADLNKEMTQAKTEITEFSDRLTALEAKHKDTAYQQLDTVQLQIATIQEQIKKINNKVARLAVRAPDNGIVKNITVNTIGGVIGAGEPLLELVPLDKNLVIEAKISPMDVGHLSIGQPVKVKVDSFDFSRYGALDGHLKFISATTFVDENNQSYYRGHVALQNTNPNLQRRLLPGMTADVDIITGQKSIMAYLLKPVRVAAETAFTER